MTATLTPRTSASPETPSRPGLPGHERSLTTRRVRRARRVIAARRRAPDRAFRPDIEGLRAIAVLAVVVYHAGLGLPGGYVGVDVFLVISGFLITKQLARMVSTKGLRSLPTFYAHRVRRLLPAAVLVVVVTTIAFRFWGPPLKVRDVAMDALFTAFSGLNYRLAAVGTDYQHMGAAASPLQHFWSLAVEEQFYVVWPLVVAAVLLLGRRAGRPLLVGVVVLVIAFSSWQSAVLTQVSAPWAYFSMHTRAWELGVGALLALTAPTLARLNRRLAGLLAVAGLAAVVAGALLYSDATPFPGTAAWLPVGGAAAVIAAGCGPRVLAERLLAEPLMQCLGRISYSWYLWHWPMLVITPYAVGRTLSGWERGAVVWLSLVAALASYVWVEQPVRLVSWPTWGWIGSGGLLSAAVVACSLIVVALGPATVGTGAAAQLGSVAAGATGPAPGSVGASGVPAAAPSAAQLIAQTVAAAVDIRAVPSNLTPRPEAAADSLPATSTNGCHAAFTATTQGACVYGDPAATRTAVLFGDSHAEQWQPALDLLGQQLHWRIVSWTKSACPAGRLTVFNSALNRDYTECDTWRAATVQRIGALRPTLVIMSQSENVAASSVRPEAFSSAAVQTIDALRAVGVQRIAYVQDIPTPGNDLPGCVATHLDDARACGYDRSAAYLYPERHAAMAPALAAAKVTVLDPAPWFCTDTRCPAIVGNVLVYRNSSHMTVPFSRWLAPALAPALTTTGA